MTRTLRPPAALATVAMVAVIVAGCGNGSAEHSNTAISSTGTRA